MFRFLIRTLLGVFLLGLAGTLPLQAADDTVLKPFVLGNTPAGNMEQVVTAVKDALKAQGFEEAGSYSPYPGATVIVVTSPELKAAAAKSEHGGFGAIQRVAVTDVKGKLQVSYTNPVYMANVYRMAEDLKNVSAKLEAALGRKEEFGAKGLTAEKLRKYHYMFGMEYFTDPSTLAEYGSYDEAVKAVEAGLAAGRGGTSKVYRVDIPGKQETVFGVGLKAASDKDKAMDDKYIMSEIDFRDTKSTAHLPYEMLVDGNKVYALYARFRIAIDFPDLSMMGSNSFMNIMSSPEAIRKALVEAAGGKK
jgi:hypothetical protein